MMRIPFAAILFAAIASPAAAYTAYLKPDEFWPSDGDVAIQAAYANTFFTPVIGLPNTFETTDPEGGRAIVDRIAITPTESTIEADLRSIGTYRISTGEQLGAITNVVNIDGRWRQLNEGETPPPEAEVATLQPVTLADVYVTRGRATRDVVDQPNGRLAIRPITHPNRILAADGFDVELLFDGAPLANSAVVLYASGDPDTDLETFAVTDENGRARFTFPGPGTYVIAARHRANAPQGAAATVHSHTTTLTLEALSALPAETEPESDNRRRRRRDN